MLPVYLYCLELVSGILSVCALVYMYAIRYIAIGYTCIAFFSASKKAERWAWDQANTYALVQLQFQRQPQVVLLSKISIIE